MSGPPGRVPGPPGEVPGHGGAWSWGGAWSQGVPGHGGCLVWGVSGEGAWSWGVSEVSQRGLRQNPPPRGQTHRCKNITFATSLRTVIRNN